MFIDISYDIFVTMGFNALKHVEDLRIAGVPDQQAKAQVRILHEIIESDLATKRDILDITNHIKLLENHIKLLENSNQEIKRDIKVLEKEIIKIKESISKLELRMTIKLGSLLIISLSALVALSKLNFI